MPKTKNIKPSGTGESPLANIEEWVNVVDPVTGKKRPSRNEYNATMGRKLMVLPALYRPS
ncbi:hypothetical protein EfmJHP80_26520 [Enterococcus faecium]|nr:hypothetical protein EfmJHP80_26520 [Enterococcus faecium]